jgi:hypothetical protein
MQKLQRRNFLKNSSLAAAAVAGGTLISCGSENKRNGPAVIKGAFT